MSAESAAGMRSFRVGRFIATLTMPRPVGGGVAAASIEWTPHLPKRLTPAELEQYRCGRDAALRDLCAELGISALVLEL